LTTGAAGSSRLGRIPRMPVAAMEMKSLSCGDPRL